LGTATPRRRPPGPRPRATRSVFSVRGGIRRRGRADPVAERHRVL